MSSWLRERLTICSRDVSKLIETALDESIPGDWATTHLHYSALLAALPRKPAAVELTAALGQLEALREELANQLEMQINSRNLSGNALQSERHIQNSNPDSTPEFEPAKEKGRRKIPQSTGKNGKRR